MATGRNIGIYFKAKYKEPYEILDKAAELALTYQVGTAAADLLAALTNGQLTLHPNQPLNHNNPPLTLNQTLELSAASSGVAEVSRGSVNGR